MRDAANFARYARISPVNCNAKTLIPAAALDLFTERWRRFACIAAAIVLVMFFPANIDAALNHIGVGQHQHGPSYLWVRVPLQLFLLGWALWPEFWPDRSLSMFDRTR